MASLAPTFGRGAMTNNWIDISNSDLVFVMGGNPAENHPCGFKWAIKAREKRGAKIICIDPRFNRTAAVSDIYIQIRPGTDIAFLGGLINYILQNEKYNKEYVRIHTAGPFIVREDFGFKDGLFTGYNPDTREYDKTSWDYEFDEEMGYPKMDPEMKHQRCVLNIIKEHFSRYTPEVVSEICGCSKEDFLEVAEEVAKCGAPNKFMTILYALGWTHHSYGTQLIRTATILQLLLGNIGCPGGGINALRGHSNVQGMTDLAGQNKNLPTYIKPPKPEEQTLAQHLKNRTPKKLHPASLSYWENYSKFFISFLKCMWGNAATPENDFAFDYLYKPDNGYYSWDQMIDDMYKGKIEGMVTAGINFVNNTPNAEKTIKALKNLKWMVVIDGFMIETAEFWKTKGIDPSEVQTEILILPAADFASKEGSMTNSSRWVKWKYKAVDPFGDAKDEFWIFGRFFMKIKELYEKERGAFPEPILNLAWSYKNPYYPHPEEILAEINGYYTKDVDGHKKGERLKLFTELRDDGSTACGGWLYCGVFPPEGNLAKKTDLSDPLGLGTYPNFAWNWPANRRVLYNRASADAKGRPWDPERPLLRWDSELKKWVGDTPDYPATSPPEKGIGAFIMLPEGRGRLFAARSYGTFKDGPLPEHYEPYESPVPNILHPEISNNPVAKVYKSDIDLFGTPDKYPYVITTYHLVELYFFQTNNVYSLIRLFPTIVFAEIPEELAKEKGIQNGDLIWIKTPRASVQAFAMVTKRIKPLKVAGKTVYTIGLPIHGGTQGYIGKLFEGKAKAAIANLISPNVWDPNSKTPEFKAFLCNIEKVKA